MSTVKQSDESITNLSDFVAIKANNRDARFFLKVNSSVARLPVQVILNGVVHLLFDLTHWSVPLVDFFKIQGMTGLCHPLVPLPQQAQHMAELNSWGIIDSSVT